ncbi:uncharacterized protein [Danio rerio]|uniref:C-type lectin domain-containing protein n=1 Tax=Danio rerio TaxID=7955 RepID=A0AB32TLE4_DANRE
METCNKRSNVNNPSGAQSQSEGQGRAEKQRCLLIVTVSLGLLCVVLLVIIVHQHFLISAERNMKKCTDEDLQRTQFCLPGHHTPPLRQEPTTKTTAKPTTKSAEKPMMNSSKQGNVCSLDGFSSSMDVKNWSDSREFCRNLGADLVMIKSEDRQKRISYFVKVKIGAPVWLGLTDTEIEGSMMWVDNSALNQGFWMKGEPNNNDGNEDCVFMNPIPSLKNWNDIPCSEVARVICE